MHQFNIYLSNKGHLKAIKVGWSWPAFLFNYLWALFKGLWVTAFFSFAIYLILIIWLVTSGENIELIFNAVSIIWLSIKISFGIKGNKALELSLLGRDYTLQDSVFSTSAENALYEYKPQTAQPIT